MKRIVYLLRYRFHLWRLGVPARMAMNWPAPYLTSDGDPIGDADVEHEYMCEG